MTSTIDQRSDRELLIAYSRDDDVAAFRTLSRRHGNMIFSVSLRRAGNRQLAEEATQNVLLSLSRKAGKLSTQYSNLAGWLHKSTRYEVAKLIRRESRLKKREEAYASSMMNSSDTQENENFQRLYPLLDQAIDQLRAPDREMIVRRYLEGENFRKIGTALGISEDAAQKRASRAFDRLNLYFRRKAGVTVSATALAAGISQHCTEAAPAACFELTGASASTGLGAALSSLTLATTGAQKAAMAASGLIVLGGSLILLNPGEDPTVETVQHEVETANASATATPPSSPSGQMASGSPENGAGLAAKTATPPAPSSAQEELARLEAMSPHPGKDELARRLAVKHERLLTELKKALNLSAAQVTAIEAQLDARVESFRATLDEGPQASDSGQTRFEKEKAMVTRAGAIIRGAGLRHDISPILSNSQLAAFDQYEADAWQTSVESHAYGEFAKLTSVLVLSEAQKDGVFERLQLASSEKLEEDADFRAYMALQKLKAPSQLDLTDLQEANFLAEAFDANTSTPPGSTEFKRRLREIVSNKIEEKVELLAPLLTESQKQSYREYLMRQSILASFENKPL